MAIKLPNYNITDVDFIWSETTKNSKILFYKNTFKISEKEKSTTVMRRRPDIPAWEKSSLTVDEAAAYSGVGRDKIREMTDREDCPFVLWIGSKRLIRRKKFDEYLDKVFSI